MLSECLNATREHTVIKIWSNDRDNIQFIDENLFRVTAGGNHKIRNHQLSMLPT
jgi:5'-3' exonuclease